MKHRILDAAEWPKLAQTGCELVPAQAVVKSGGVIAVEDESGEIVGTCVVYTAAIADGMWIAEGHRGRASVLRHLLDGLAEAAAEMHVNGFLVAATNHLVSDGIADKLHGTELPGRLLVMPIEALHGR